MAFNLNTTQHPEYNLNDSLIDEVIQMYGIQIKLLITEKINFDDAVFGDFTHMKTNSDSIFEMYALPENSEDFSTDGYSFSPFGITDFDNIELFVSRQSLSIDEFLVEATEKSMGTGVDGKFVDFRKLQSQLIILPNNKIMEITDVDPCVPGVNNLFTHNDAKSVYKLTCKPYNVKLINELNPNDITAPEFTDFSLEFGEDIVDDTNNDMDSTDSYDSLTKYFDELTNEKNIQDNEANVKEDKDFIIQNDETDDEIVKSTIVNKDEKDIFGNYS